jgi:hypothetical protein
MFGNRLYISIIIYTCTDHTLSQNESTLKIEKYKNKFVWIVMIHQILGLETCKGSVIKL